MGTAGHRPARPASAAARFDRGELAAIFCGGFLGALARAGVEQALAVRAGQWPWATFAVNILAALLLGWFVTHPREHARGVHPHSRSFLTVGVCGALSTFSTMMLELLRMLDGSHWALAFGYAGASLAGGLLAVRVSGRLAARRRVRG
jgi:CrcB protein